MGRFPGQMLSDGTSLHRIVNSERHVERRGIEETKPFDWTHGTGQAHHIQV